MFSVKNKVCIVTGATRGIGLTIAETLAENKAHVVVCSSSPRKSEALAKTLSERYQTNCLGVQTDVSDIMSCDTLIKETINAFGKIDVLINNAGITRDNLILRLKPEDWDAVIHTNLTSVFNTTKLAIRPMLKKKSGTIINISSVVGLIGNAGQSNYAASKAGMIGFSKSIAKEFGNKGITCNVVAPGFIDTEMLKSLPEEYINNIIQEVPLKRLGSAQDVSNVVLFLASGASSYITGEVISVDGGIQM